MGGPPGWRSCCTRRTTPPATNPPESIWADHLGDVRVALGAPRPRQQARKVRVALGAPPSPLVINPRSIWLDHLGGVRVALGAPRPRQQIYNKSAVVGPPGWRSCCTRRTTPPATNSDETVDERSTQVRARVRTTTSTSACCTKDLRRIRSTPQYCKLPRGGGSPSPLDLKSAKLRIFQRPTSTKSTTINPHHGQRTTRHSIPALHYTLALLELTCVL